MLLHNVFRCIIEAGADGPPVPSLPELAHTEKHSAASACNPTGDESTGSGEAAEAWSRERKLMENMPPTNEVSRERGDSNPSR